MIKVLLVDDQPTVRHGLRMRLALEPDVMVVGEADDGAAALDMTAKLRPDIVVMDVEMPIMDGITACAALRQLAPDSRVVILTIYDDNATHGRADVAGAAAFIGKCEAAEALPAAIRQVALQHPPSP